MSDSGKDLITPETESYAGRLFDTVRTLYGFLLNAPTANARNADAEPSLAGAVETASDIETYLIEMNPKVQHIYPRQLSEKDKQRLAPGEHAGFTLRFESDGKPIVVNCYGGLRDPKFHQDMHDSNPSGRNTHTTRTDETASKPKYLNIHSNGAFDIWMTISNDKLTLRSLQSEGSLVDITSTMGTSIDPYKQTVAQLQQAISYFTQLVDNPVSPR